MAGYMLTDEPVVIGRKDRKDLDVFAANLADVYRGLVRIGWDECTARDFVDGLNENRYECIKLRKQVEALREACRRQLK